MSNIYERLINKLRECHKEKYKQDYYKLSCNLCAFNEICKDYHKFLKLSEIDKSVGVICEERKGFLHIPFFLLSLNSQRINEVLKC